MTDSADADVHANHCAALHAARLEALIEWRMGAGSVFEVPLVFACVGPPKCGGENFLTCRACYPLRANDPRSVREAMQDMKNWSNQ